MGQFWKYTLASLTGSLLFFVLLVICTAMGAVGLLGVLLASLARGDAPSVPKDAMLVYDLGTVITDLEYIPNPSEVLLGGVSSQLTLRQAVTAIREAAEDENIAGLYLRGGSGMGAGLAAQLELRKAIEAFQDSGKPVVAYGLAWDEQEYWLASVADTVFMNPFGQLEMNGLVAEVMYQAEALSKLGVGVQVTRVGKYKSAVEPLIRNDMSPEEREQIQRLMGDLWQTMLDGITETRGLEVQALQEIANNQGYLFGEEAETSKLIDKVVYEDEVIDTLRSHTGESEKNIKNDQPSFRQISLSRYADSAEDPLGARNSKNRIALVYAEGPIIDGDTPISEGNVIVGGQVARLLRQLRQDDAVKAVVLRVNSPGGTVTASEVILREVQLLRQDGKPVVVSMGNMAASGGYWIASLADAIVAEPTTITGSIGVFGRFINFQELGDKVGLNWDRVKTAELADIASSTRPKSEQEIAIFQKSVDRVYDEFLQRVVEGRGLQPATVAEIAQGRVWSGIAARELGLVDELGGLDSAISIAADLAELGDDWSLKPYPEGDEWQRFLERFFEPVQAKKPDPLTEHFNTILGELRLLQTVNDPQGIYALMPFMLKVD